MPTALRPLTFASLYLTRRVSSSSNLHTRLSAVGNGRLVMVCVLLLLVVVVCGWVMGRYVCCVCVCMWRERGSPARPGLVQATGAVPPFYILGVHGRRRQLDGAGLVRQQAHHLAVGETVTLLHPSPFIRRSNMDGRWGGSKTTVSPTATITTSAMPGPASTPTPQPSPPCGELPEFEKAGRIRSDLGLATTLSQLLSSAQTKSQPNPEKTRDLPHESCGRFVGVQRQ